MGMIEAEMRNGLSRYSMTVFKQIISKKAVGMASLCVFFALPLNAPAQGSPSADEPQARGGSIWQGAVQLGGSYTNNFYYTPDSRRSVAGLILAPELSYGYVLPDFRVFAKGSGEAARFNSGNHNDNYVDGKIHGGFEWQAAARQRFLYGVGADFAHDPYGTNRTAGSLAENSVLDQWHTVGTDLKYFYGLKQDILNLEATLSGQRRQYTTNKSVTSLLDYSNALADVTLFYNYSPKTALLFNIAGARTTHDQDATKNLDSTELHYLIGTSWLATAKTSADIRVGYVIRRQRITGSEQLRSVDWRANIRWAPTRYRSFILQTARLSQESYLPAIFSFVDNRAASLEWDENLNSRLTTKTSVGYLQSRFVGSSRVDENYFGNLAVEYKANEYATVLGTLNYGKRDSNTAGLRYDRLYSYIGIKLSN